MNSVLSMRLKRLEKRANLDDPLRLLSDEELDRRIDEIDASIAAEVGMSIPEYADHLRSLLETGSLLLEGVTEDEAVAFAKNFIRRQTERTDHGR